MAVSRPGRVRQLTCRLISSDWSVHDGVMDFELSDDEMAAVAALASPKGRLTDFGFAPKWD